MKECKERIPLNKITHSVRASQAVLQYGVGAMVDFPEQTLMTAAPETWASSVMEIHDERLEKVLDVGYFGMPGSRDDGKYQKGISYVRFPEWYFCPKCRSFKPLKEWQEDYSRSSRSRSSRESDPYMVKRLKCPNCHQDLVVARIVTVCGHGHIDDFPWVKWVHARNVGGRKKVCENPKLTFSTSASSSEGLEGLTIKCVACNCRATLQGAFEKDALKVLDEKTGYEYGFQCNGRHPWKNDREPCGEYPHVMQRGGSSVYFPISSSSLVIPPYSSRLTKDVQDSLAFSDLRKAITEGLKTLNSIGIPVTQEMKDQTIKSKIEEFTGIVAKEIGRTSEQVRPILERRWLNKEDPEYTTSSVKYRAEEYAALSGEVIIEDKTGEFVREGTEISAYGLPYIKNISLIHKIREVQALVGFSRLKPVEDEMNEDAKVKMVSIKEDSTKWYPGYEVRGEGIFVEFDEDAIDRWRTQNTSIVDRTELINTNYKNSYYGEIRGREISSKFLFLHTVSHLLMKQLSFECGYSIAAIKERLYCSEPSEGRSMAGVLIYTASGDSEGTMGGLVRQGRPDTFPSIFKKAIEGALVCSNDPVCGLSQGQGRDSLNLAACHSCTLVPETSCEEYNVFLDRGAVIGTFDNRKMGLYSGAIGKWIDSFNEFVEEKKGTEKESKISVLVTDSGTDLKSVSYDKIWGEIISFSDDETEKTILSEMAAEFMAVEKAEKPHSGGTIRVTTDKESMSVDLIWIQSKVMFFSAENMEEYEKCKDSDWKCFCSGDDNFDWHSMIKELEA